MNSVGLRRTLFLPRHFTLRLSSKLSFATVSKPAQQIQQVTWTDFLAARRSKRLWERIGSGTFATVGLIGGGIYFFFIAEIDPFQPRVFGVLDAGTAYTAAPFLVAAIAGTVGLSLGGLLWRAFQKSNFLKLIDLKEKEFFKRIAQNRPKELRSSGINNPVPDYYGEKITSVAEYRAWLRKQRKYAAVTNAGGVVGARLPGMDINLAGKRITELAPKSKEAKSQMGLNKAKKINLNVSAAIKDARDM
ncbi:TIM23 complex component [Nowakowskiella sp. JEL0407]|nr:TIM23 complex component [Nowakowskiella sp. JEL0407]